MHNIITYFILNNNCDAMIFLYSSDYCLIYLYRVSCINICIYCLRKQQLNENKQLKVISEPLDMSCHCGSNISFPPWLSRYLWAVFIPAGSTYHRKLIPLKSEPFGSRTHVYYSSKAVCFTTLGHSVDAKQSKFRMLLFVTILSWPITSSAVRSISVCI